MNGTILSNFLLCKNGSGKILQNFAKLNSLPKFREIRTEKFRKINNLFREISYFAKLWKPTFVATLVTTVEASETRGRSCSRSVGEKLK